MRTFSLQASATYSQLCLLRPIRRHHLRPQLNRTIQPWTLPQSRIQRCQPPRSQSFEGAHVQGGLLLGIPTLQTGRSCDRNSAHLSSNLLSVNSLSSLFKCFISKPSSIPNSLPIKACPCLSHSSNTFIHSSSTCELLSLQQSGKLPLV